MNAISDVATDSLKHGESNVMNFFLKEAERNKDPSVPDTASEPVSV